MIWGYLTEFWDKITAAAVGTVEYFQSIGNAVSGAMGGLFDEIIHYAFDSILIFRYFFEIAKQIFFALWQPVLFFFNFFQSYIQKLNEPITYGSPLTFVSGVSTILNAVPSWSVLSTVIGAAFLFLIGFAAIKIIAAE